MRTSAAASALSAHHLYRLRRPLGVTAAALALALATACGGQQADSGSSSTASEKPAKISRAKEVSTQVGTPKGETSEESSRKPRLALTHDGGVIVLDAVDLTLLGEFPLDGFTRLNPAGDGRHLFVSEGEGFRLLDVGSYTLPHGDHDHHHSTEPTLTELTYPASHPGHVVAHDGRTVLYSDGDGTMRSIDPEMLREGVTTLPKGEVETVKPPHHGVAVARKDGSLVSTTGTADGANGIVIHDKKGAKVASAKCPGVHGEAAAKDGALVFGCEKGLLMVKEDSITPVEAPDPYGRIGNQAGDEESPFVLGDYKTDPDAELERPKQVSITDTRDGSLEIVDLPASYSFRSLARGPQGEGVVLGTDGALHIIDMAKGKVTDSIEVVDAWREPVEWQQPRPTVFVQDGTAYVTEPQTKTLHMVDLESGEVINSGILPVTPNEISGTQG